MPRGSKGIRQWTINLCTYILNDDTLNYPFSRLKLVVETFEYSTQLYEPTIQNSLNSQKLLSQRIRKCYSKTLGTSVTNSSLSSSLSKFVLYQPSLMHYWPTNLKTPPNFFWDSNMNYIQLHKLSLHIFMTIIQYFAVQIWQVLI